MKQMEAPYFHCGFSSEGVKQKFFIRKIKLKKGDIDEDKLR